MRSHSSKCNTLHIVDIRFTCPREGWRRKGLNQEPRVSHKTEGEIVFRWS